jgi:hypothetical protein
LPLLQATLVRGASVFPHRCVPYAVGLARWFPDEWVVELDGVEEKHKRSLHFADHRFAMICFGRDDRVEKIETSPTRPKTGLSGSSCFGALIPHLRGADRDALR